MKNYLTTSTALIGAAALAIVSASCSGGKKNEGVIQNQGSDTLVQVAQAWAEAYKVVDKEVKIQVQGGGSGPGINAMIEGTIDIANASRAMKDKELAKFKEKHNGQEAIEHIVGYDGLAVYVHPSCPIDKISIEELAEIFGENGKITNWSEVGGPDGGFVKIGRQSGSGTYQSFLEIVVGKDRDYAQDIGKMSGSQEVVDQISTTPLAIGYSGMGYKNDKVKWLAISKEKGGESFLPTADNVKSGAYPIARSLLMYTAGEPAGEIKKYLDWVKGADGQKILSGEGFVPLQ